MGGFTVGVVGSLESLLSPLSLCSSSSVLVPHDLAYL